MLRLLVLLLVLSGPQVALAQQIDEPKIELSPSELVEAAIREFYENAVSDDEDVRIAAIKKLYPEEKDYLFLLGEKYGKLAWSFSKPELEEAVKQNAMLKRELNLGPFTDLTIKEMDRADHSGLSDIPSDVRIFQSFMRWENSAAGARGYVVMGKRVKFVQGLERMIPRLKQMEQDKNDQFN